MHPSPPEPPAAVVAFLLGGCRLSPDVFAAVLRELASEDMVRFGMDASGTQVIGPGAPSPRSGRSLLPFEDAMLGRLRTRTGGRAGIPLWVLLSDDGDGYGRWQQMQAQLGREAQRAGLAVRSAGKGAWQTALALAVLAACTAVVVYQVAPKAGLDATAAAVVVGFLAVVVLPLSMWRWRLTPTGATAVAQWRQSGGSPR